MNTPLPTQTPNVVITNPKARKIARTVLDVVGLTIGTIIVVDGASNGFDWGFITVPAFLAWGYLRAGFGLGVDNPNTPS